MRSRRCVRAAFGFGVAVESAASATLLWSVPAQVVASTAGAVGTRSVFVASTNR